MTASIEPTVRRFKPHSTYKDSGVEWLGDVPAHWNVVSLKRVVDPARPVTYGIVQCGPDLPEGIPYIRPVDMSDEKGVNPDSLQRTSPEIAAAYRRSTVRPGDIVVSIGPSFGKAMIVPCELDGANLTQGTARVAPAADVASRFLFWSLRSVPVRQAWDSYCSGATFRALTLEILESCEIAVPSFPEQIAIASFLDRETARIDALVAQKERLIELLQEKRTALITRAVTRGLDSNVPMKGSGIEWLEEIPADWEVTRIKHLANVASGLAPPETSDRSQGAYPVFGSNGLIGYCDQYLTAEEMIAVGRVGASGSVNIVPPRSWVSDNALLLHLKHDVRLLWLRYVLEAMNLGTQAMKNACISPTRPVVRVYSQDDGIRERVAVVAPRRCPRG